MIRKKQPKIKKDLKIKIFGITTFAHTFNHPDKHAREIIEKMKLKNITKTKKVVDSPAIEIEEYVLSGKDIKSVMGTKVTYIINK